MKKKNHKEKRKYDILWDQLELQPSVLIKEGIRRKRFPLTKQFTGKREALYFVNNYIELTGKWSNSPGFGSILSLKLKNISKKSFKITRLTFPTENGLDDFLNGFSPSSISFLRNGYQSWSTTRSYKITDKPLRPWLQLVSTASSNMANLPSNIPGELSSEMYSVITDVKKDESFLVGQAPPFNQFFYIKLFLYKHFKDSYFELVFDFGRKLLEPNEEIELDGIIMAKGETVNLQRDYFTYINKKIKKKMPQTNIKGWSTWYYYYDKISPEIIYENLDRFKEYNVPIDFVQIDDGYQSNVGDWLTLRPQFYGRMKEITTKIKEAGYKPGIWIAPFIADSKSELAKIHPDYLLRTEYGKVITAGYNPTWPGNFYYSLDISNKQVEEYIRKVIYTIVHEWGFEYLKLDFLFGCCMRGGHHQNQSLSRAGVMKKGLKIIRETAGKNVILSGCGAPLSTGIENIDVMRVGPDTAPLWKKVSGFLLRTGAMLGTRNSIRNFMVRSFMNKKLWVNDPDCLMLREKNTKLTADERMTQINAIILSGGILMFSDDFSKLSQKIMNEVNKIITLSEVCYSGEAIPIDLMEREIPHIYYNTSGYIGFFNFSKKTISLDINLNKYEFLIGKVNALTDIWSKTIILPDTNNNISVKGLLKHSSKLFKIN